MSDTEPSAPDHLDQLFSSPPTELGSSLSTPVPIASDLEPIRGSIEFERRPELISFGQLLLRLTPVVWVTPALVLANVAVYIAMIIGGVNPWMPDADELMKWGANYAPLTWGGQPWRLLTSMFLHGGILHLGFNMWALWRIGLLLERLIGNIGFLLVYFWTGLVGSLASLWWNGDIASVGASGAIFGLIGAFATFIWNRSDSFPMQTLSELRNSVVTCIGFNLLIGASIEVIDQAAHVGGLVCGLICGQILSQPLDSQTRQRRLVKNAVVAVTAILSVGGAVINHPPPPPNLIQVLSDYDHVVMTTLNKWNDIQKSMFNRNLNLKQVNQFMSWIQKEILPEWHELRVRFEGLKNIPPRRKELIELLRHQLIVREEAWLLLVDALRRNDQSKVQEFQAKWQQAEILDAKSRTPQ